MFPGGGTKKQARCAPAWCDPQHLLLFFMFWLVSARFPPTSQKQTCVFFVCVFGALAWVYSCLMTNVPQIDCMNSSIATLINIKH